MSEAVDGGAPRVFDIYDNTTGGDVRAVSGGAVPVQRTRVQAAQRADIEGAAGSAAAVGNDHRLQRPVLLHHCDCAQPCHVLLP